MLKNLRCDGMMIDLILFWSVFCATFRFKEGGATRVGRVDISAVQSLDDYATLTKYMDKINESRRGGTQVK